MSAKTCVLAAALAACAPSARSNPGTQCSPGEMQDCYSGLATTQNVGPCHAGTQTCGEGGMWGACEGEVVPAAEVCGDGVDNNCNGKVDEDEDADGDGWTTCGGDCCDSTECNSPALVNPGAFDVPGNGVDDDCNGIVDDSAALCDQALASDSSDGMDFAKAIDLCQTALMTDKKWGVISAELTLADGTGVPDPLGYSIRHHFGQNLIPQGGVSMALLSTGAAAGKGDIKPAFHDFVSYTHAAPNTSPFPADFLAANDGTLPNAPGCPAPNGSTANDPVMLTLTVRVPTNAQSFKLMTNFYSAEFPEWTCSAYNDFFVVLLDSAFAGDPANPADKNLAFYTPANSTMKYPVGVNLAYGDTGLFTQCMNGTMGCDGHPSTISSCTSIAELVGTGFDDPTVGQCDYNSLKGGATGWLTTAGNVKPGEIIKLRIAIWDTSDHAFDSLAVIDGFQWSLDLSQPGTVILRR